MREAIESCRHWNAKKLNRCGERATIIVWGKLYDPDQLGPRCSAHWPAGFDEWNVRNSAVFDLRPFMAEVVR